VVAAARDIILLYSHMSICQALSEKHTRGSTGEGSAMPPTMPATRDAFPQSNHGLASGSGISSSLKGSPLPASHLGGWDGQRNSSARSHVTEFEELEQFVLSLAHKSGLHKVGDSIRLFPCGGSAVLGIRQASTRRQRGTGMRYTHRAARDIGRTSLGHRSVRGRVLDRATGRGHAGAVQRCLRERYNGALGYLNRAP